MLFYLCLLDTDDDKSKFEQLYLKYRKLMKYLALNILNNEQLAEDAVHDTFVKIANNIHKIDEISCDKTKHFISIVLENTCKDIEKKAQKEAPGISEDIEAPFTTEDIILSSYKIETIANAILRLPDKYKDVFTLKYSHDYSDKDIAKLLNVTHVTARKRLQRARLMLIDLLKKDFSEE